MKIINKTKTFSITKEEEIVSIFKYIIDGFNNAHEMEVIRGQFYNDLMVAFTEGVANAIVHGKEIKKSGAVKGQIKLNSKKIEIKIEDHGKGYSLKKIPMPDFSKLDDSGRGVFMMQQLMDKVEYIKEKKKNTLILSRNLIGSQNESKDLDLLYEISEAILQSTDPEHLYSIILDKTIEVFKVERASILIYDKKLKKLNLVASRGIKNQLKKQVQIRPGDGISGFVFQHAKPCLIEDIESNKAGWEKKKGYKSRSFISAPMICSPMKLGSESIGVINVTDRIDGKPFSKKDLRLLTTIANQATAYLYIGQLMAEKKDAEIIRRELEIARDIQRSYLPKNAPEIKDIHIEGWLETPQSIGGDYYDFIQIGDHSLYVIIADVSGHDIAAAMTMANFRSQLRAALYENSDVGVIVTQLNKLLYEDLSKNNQFISLILVKMDLNTRKVSYANAGHRPPLIIKNNTQLSHGDDLSQGTVIGVLEDESYESISLEIQRGSFLILYTDGLTEAHNKMGERLGLESLLHHVLNNESSSAKELIEGLKKYVAKFRKDAPLTDDISIVVMQFK